MRSNFWLSAALVFFVVLRLCPDLCDEPLHHTTIWDSPFSVRFAPVSLNYSAIEIVLCRKFSHLKSSSCHPLFLLLLLAGDVEINPGPRHFRFPCGVCSAPVKSNQRGVQCEVCANWLHTRCIGVSNEEYASLQQSDDPW